MNTFEYKLQPMNMSSDIEWKPFKQIIHNTVMCIIKTSNNKSAQLIISCSKKQKNSFGCILINYIRIIKER